MSVVTETTVRNEANADQPPEGPPSSGVSAPAPPAPVLSLAPAPAAVMPFKITLRGRIESDAQAQTIEADTAAAAFERTLNVDVTKIDEPLIIWRDREKAVALDFDRPDDAPRLCDADIETIMTPGAPTPAYAWITHGGGLRVIFFMLGEVSALALAGLWLMFARLGQLGRWQLEVKTDTRHPAGLRDGTACGAVFGFQPSVSISLRGDAGAVSAADITAWLDARGLTMGRHGTELCPWSCGPSSGNPPVSVTDHGVRCFRCGRSARWPELVGAVDAADAALYRAARALVHLGHQQHVIAALHPIVPAELIAPAWGQLLRVVHADHLAMKDEDERAIWKHRVETASSGALDIVRSSSGGWFDATTLNPRRKVSADRTLKFLPSCFWPPMVDKADDTGPLEGFIPIHPIGANEVLGPDITAPRGTLLVRRPRAEGDPPEVNVTSRPTLEELETAWRVIETALPGVCRGYHFGIVIAMLVAQRGVGTPPIICATGQSGSAKTAQVHLAAGALGSKAAQIVLGTTDDTTRKAGLALEEGAGALFADEIGRVEGVFTKLEPILSANSVLPYRPKYANERRAPLRSAVLLLGSTLPESIVRSPELARRAVGYRLTGADKNWTLLETKTGTKLDLTEARRIDWLRPALDVVTASAWWAVHDLGPAGDWRKLLRDSYGAVALANLDLVDSDGAAREQAILALYEAFRNAKADELSTITGWSDWLIADPGCPAGNELNVLVELDAEKPRFMAATSDLERLNLRPILGFANPQLQLLVRRRSPHILVKFVEVGVLRGKGTPRGKLPAAAPPAKTDTGDNVTVTL